MNTGALNAERLLALYERVADAPDAIARLGRFVLDLAVRGKLVEQDPNDEPASELLKRIATEKARLVKAGEIKKPKPSEPINDGDITYAVPSSWTWTRLAEIAVCLDYMRKPINSTEREKRNEGKSEHELYPYFGATQQQGWIDEYIFDEELVLLGEDGVPFFEPFRSKAYLITGKTWVNNHAHVFKGIFVSHPFLVHYLNVFDYSGRVVGATRSKLNQARATDIPFPLPPLVEQRRIVAKVEELMALLDRLEAARTTAEANRERLTAASLTRLTATDTTPEAFPAHARFAFDALPALTTRRGQIKALRQTILNLAVRGKLVGQDPNDEPANSELEKVVRLKSKHNLRKAKKVAQIQDAEKWCRTPVGWEWARWDEIANWITYGFTRPMEHVDNGVPIVTGKNVNEDQIIFSTASLTSQEAFDALSEKDKPQPGDILITKDGSIGRSAIVEEEHLPFCINQSVAVIWLRSCHFNRQYLKLVLDAPQTQNALLEKAAGMAIKHISITDLGKMVFPVPPLPEQNRIVAKVDALMALCDRLEAALTTADTTKQHLLEALLHEALTPAATPRELEAAAV